MNNIHSIASLLLFLFFSLPVPGQELPRTMYVLNGWGSNSLSKMNMEEGTISNHFLTGIGVTPNQILAFDNTLYIVNSVPDEIKIIDPLHGGVPPRSIALTPGSNPWAMAFAGTEQAYVTNQQDGSVSRVDLSEGCVVTTIPTGPAPQGILITGNEAWVTNTHVQGWSSYGQGSVSLIDILSDTMVTTLNVPVNPQTAVQAPDPDGWGGTYIHILCTGDYASQTGKIAVINRWAPPAYSPAVVDTIDIGGQPGDLIVTPDGKGYCCAWGDENYGHIYIYDALTGEIIRGAGNPVPVGPGASSLLYDETENCLWISNQTAGTVQQFDIDADTVCATHEFGMSAMDMALVGPLGRPDPWADRAVSFDPGSGAGFGANYFPLNILGPPDPDPSVSATNPSSKPEEILSLGHGGIIVLEFTNNRIIDREGPDFTVFENAFRSWNGSVFMEAGIVSVSQNGHDWVTFPWDTAALTGLAGITPIGDNQNPLDPSVSGGDQFDLADVGLSWASFVKIEDMGDRWQEPFGGGDFDLDAVGAIHSAPLTAVHTPEPARPRDFSLSHNYPNPFNPITTLEFTLPCRARADIRVYSITGREISILFDDAAAAGSHRVTWNGTDKTGTPAASGLYICRMKSGSHTIIRKMTLLR